MGQGFQETAIRGADIYGSLAKKNFFSDFLLVPNGGVDLSAWHPRLVKPEGHNRVQEFFFSILFSLVNIFPQSYRCFDSVANGILRNVLPLLPAMEMISTHHRIRLAGEFLFYFQIACLLHMGRMWHRSGNPTVDLCAFYGYGKMLILVLFSCLPAGLYTLAGGRWDAASCDISRDFVNLGNTSEWSAAFVSNSIEHT